MKKAFVTLSVLALGMLAFQTAADFSFETKLKSAIKNVTQQTGSIVEVEYMPDISGINTGFNMGRRGKGRNPFGNFQQQAMRSNGIVLTEDGIILLPEQTIGNFMGMFGNMTNMGGQQNSNQEKKIKKIKIRLKDGSTARAIFIAYEPDTKIYFIKAIQDDLESPLKPLMAKANTSPLEIGDTFVELSASNADNDYAPIVNFNIVNQLLKSPKERALTSIASPIGSLAFKPDGSLVGIRLSDGIYKLSTLSGYIEKVKEAAAQMGEPEYEEDEEVEEEFEDKVGEFEDEEE